MTINELAKLIAKSSIATTDALVSLVKDAIKKSSMSERKKYNYLRKITRAENKIKEQRLKYEHI